MNVIKWIRGWFRKPEPYAYWDQEFGDYILNVEPAETPFLRKMKLNKLHKDLDDCKKRLEAALKAKKGGVPALRKELQEKKTQGRHDRRSCQFKVI